MAAAIGFEFRRGVKTLMGLLQGMPEPRLERLGYIVILLISLAGMAWIAYSTVWGPGVSSDAVYYILSADYWVKGVGFGLPWGSGRFLPYAGNPPFYPMLVAGLEWLGFDLITAARWICVLAFGGMILAMGWLGYRVTRSFALAMGSSLIALSSPLFLDLFSKAISEPAFFALGISGGLWFLYYLETSRWRDLILASILISAAFLTRYPGIALAATAGLSLLVLSRSPWRLRMMHASLYGAIVALPMALWLRWSYAQTGELGERTLAPWTELPARLIDFRLRAAEVVWGWLPWLGQISTDYNARKNAFVVVLILGVLLVIGIFLRHRGDPDLRAKNRFLLRWLFFWGMFCLIFFLVYLLGYAFTIPTPDLNERLFSPLYIGAIFTLLGLLVCLARSWASWRWLAALVWIVVAVSVSHNVPVSLRLARALHQDGFGYTGRDWRESPVIAAIRSLPPGTPIITNEADAVLFLTGRPAVWLPDVIASQPAEVMARFGDSPAQLPEEIVFRQKGGALVIFPSIERQLSRLYGEWTAQRLQTLTAGLAVYARFEPNEVIYFYDPDFFP